MSSQSKKNPGHQKTMEYIILFLRNMKSQRYKSIRDLLYNIRTNDLRELLEQLGRDHLFYRTILEVLQNPDLANCHREALYNLAVVLGEKANVQSMLRHDALNIILSFQNNEDIRTLYNCLWCLFGISSSTPNNRQICIDNGVLEIAINKMISKIDDSITDIGGQVLYGMCHMRPYLTKEMAKPFFDHIPELLSLNENSLKYTLWSLHFSIIENPEMIVDLKIESSLEPLMSSEQNSVLIPLNILVSEVFKFSQSDLNNFLEKLRGPLQHDDSNVRLQACRTTAEYIRNEQSIEEILADGLYEIVIKVAQEDLARVKEQAVYAIIRGYGLGSLDQKKRLSELGGLETILNFSVEAASPFNCNLLDCITSLIEEDKDYFTKKLREIDAPTTLYKLLASYDQALISKAANILAIVGDE